MSSIDSEFDEIEFDEKPKKIPLRPLWERVLGFLVWLIRSLKALPRFLFEKPKREPGKKWVIYTRAKLGMTVSSIISLVGIGLDFYYHINGLIKGDENPLTLPHMIMYIGLAGVFSFLITPFVSNLVLIKKQKGKILWSDIPEAVPLDQSGWLSVIGALTTVAGVVSDFVGHGVWGFEVGASSLYSFPHIAIGLGFIMMFGSTYADYMRVKPVGKVRLQEWPAMFSFLMIVVFESLIFHHSHPIELGGQTEQGVFIRLGVVEYLDEIREMEIPFYRNLKDVTTSDSTGHYLIHGILIMGLTTIVTSIRHKMPDVVIVLGYMAHALPTFFYDRGYLMWSAVLLGMVVAFLLKRFPLYRLPRPAYVYVYTVGIPLLMYTTYTVSELLVQRTLWWANYVYLGIPMVLVIGGILVGTALLLLINARSDIEAAQLRVHPPRN